MRVFIAEKPSQGRDIAAVLGCTNKGNGCISNDKDVVTWGFGHLLQPADPEKYHEKYKRWNLSDLPIIPETWKLTPNPQSKAQLAIVKGWIDKADEVVIATDADREGELIARLILGHARYKGEIKRLWLSALDDASIKKALDNLKPGKATESLFWAGLGRQRADWMTGMSYTRAATLLFGGAGDVCSVGRVQSPTLRLIVERDAEIDNFVAKDFYTIVAEFAQNDQCFNCDWVIPESAKGDEEGRCLDKKIAEAVKAQCLAKQGEIITYETKKKSQQAPLPFSLSELQKAANNRYGYDAKAVLQTAQALYESHKATTYPRSDCGYLPLTQKPEVTKIIKNLALLDDAYKKLSEHCKASFKSRCWNDKKVGESSHHAIIPTNNTKVVLSNMSEMERNVFDLITRQYLAQFMGNYTYNETVIEIDCAKERFKTKGIIPSQLGWKHAFVADKTSKTKNKKEQILPALEQSKPVTNTDVTIFDKKTTPPAHYNDATLISAMKNCGRKVDDEDAKKIFAEVQGIGTEATRADIIETLKTRQYIENRGKFLISTAKGQAIIEVLPDVLTNIEITAKWEQILSEVAKGKSNYKDFIGGIQNSLRENINQLKNMPEATHLAVDHHCPKCNEQLVRFRKKNSRSFWWGCSGYKNGCDISMDDVDGMPKARKPIVTSDIECPKCKTHKLIQRTSKYDSVFWACSGYPKCSASFKDHHGKPTFEAKSPPKKSDKKCSKCNSAMLIRTSAKGEFLGCSAFPQCKNTEVLVATTA